MGRRAAVLLCLAFGCDEGGSDSGGFETTTTPSTKGSGGFSSDLAKSMGSDGKTTVAVNDKKGSDAGSAKGTDAVKGTDAGSAKGTDAGSAKGTDAGSAKGTDAGSAKGTDAGSAKGTDAGSAKGTDAGSAKGTDAKGTDAKGSAAKGTDAKGTDAKGTDAKGPDAKGSAATKGPDVKVTAGSGEKPPEKGPPPIDTAKPRVYVKPSAEIGLIKLSLLPNWDRDYGDAGTISLVVKVPGTDQTRVFAFRYGYEDPKAPNDRDAYKKWLADNGILKAPAGGTLIDRQRGGSWYLEGVDGSGVGVFRNIVVYGGKKLICGGSLYRDAVSNQLGDIRDKTILQAKEICGELGL